MSRIDEIRALHKKMKYWHLTNERRKIVRYDGTTVALLKDPEEATTIIETGDAVAFLLAEVDRLTKERDAAMKDLKLLALECLTTCMTCADDEECRARDENTDGCDGWQWRGAQTKECHK